MTSRERENATLLFIKPKDRGSVEETFYPWTATFDRWKKEGHLENVPDDIFNETGKKVNNADKYLSSLMADGVFKYEKFLGFDGVKRVSFNLPLRPFNKTIIEDTDDYVIQGDDDGWTRKYYKNSSIVETIRPVVTCPEDWYNLKEAAYKELDKYYTDDNIQKIYTRFKDGHEKGDYSLRMNITGFFWTPRTLLGIEEHLYAFYDYPEMMHDMNNFFLDVYFEKLGIILDILPADVLYIMEDLSGCNGPMLSPELFDEFVGAYYKRLVPFLMSKGVGNVFVDTDGDFLKLIPNFICSGIEGFLPMDVNAGMDIVEVRKYYPRLKFIGGFNKLAIEAGREAIDKEFKRLMPVIRQGGYIPGCDHQVTHATPFENYKYYISKLKECMHEAGSML
jgi:hypothetical protein